MKQGIGDRERKNRAIVTAFAIQKGGEGKTTATVNIAAYVAMRKNRRVCLIDMDPSGNATVASTGSESRKTFLDVIEGSHEIREIQRISPYSPNLTVIPGGKPLTHFASTMSGEIGREYKMADALEASGILGDYDHIFIDSPPTLDLTTVSVLTAADNVVVPTQCAKFSVQGLVALFYEIGKIRHRINPNLGILGVFVNMWSGRETLQRNVLSEVADYLSGLNVRLFDSKVRDSVSVNEAALACMPVFMHRPGSIADRDISVLAEEVYVALTGVGAITTEEEKPLLRKM